MASEYTSNANNAVDASKHVGQFSNCEQATHAVPLEVHNADSSSFIRMRLQEVLMILNFVEALDQNTWIFLFWFDGGGGVWQWKLGIGQE